MYTHIERDREMGGGGGHARESGGNGGGEGGKRRENIHQLKYDCKESKQ